MAVSSGILFTSPTLLPYSVFVLLSMVFARLSAK
jgi:hypothetical protein